ncbi:MAG: M28 family peptidase [Deltaproteobacteria bacterium]|nr:M28 family peptidase [Deltaproteobacteria bacterium]
MISSKIIILFIGTFFAATLVFIDPAWSSQNSKNSPGETNTKIRVLVDQVSRKNLLETLTYLTSFKNRSSYEVQEEVLIFIAGDLGNAGAAIRFHDYEFDGRIWHNLVATVPGDASFDQGEPYLVVGAHVDSVSTSPGADDNASGVSAIMETARVLAGAKLPMRVDFVFFTREEVGPKGSSFYAADAKASKAAIKAMIAVDMVGFDSSGGDLDLVTKPSMDWIVKDYKAASDVYTQLSTTAVIKENCG